MGNRITGSTKRIEVLVALGQRSADLLAGNTVVAGLAPAVAEATGRLAQAKDARKTAANARYVTRQAVVAAEQAVEAAARAAQLHALEACDGDREDAAYRTLFPEGLGVMVQGPQAQREPARKLLARHLGADPAHAAFAKRLDDALAVQQAAVQAWKQAQQDERVAVRALALAARACQVACMMARLQAIVLLGDVAAARIFFPREGTKEPATVAAEPQGSGTGKPGVGTVPKADGGAPPAPETGQGTLNAA